MLANNAYVLGLTGGIACGKSAAASHLKSLGAAVVDVDEISRSMTAENGIGLPAIMDAFGKEVFLEDGRLNRAALGDIVFRNVEKKRVLEGILHPLIQKEALAKMQIAAEKGAKAIVLDVPLLFETGMDALCDEVWVLSVPRETQITRIMERDGKDRQQAEDRIDSQMPLSEKEKKARVVIHTDRSYEDTCRELSQLYKDLLKRIQRS